MVVVGITGEILETNGLAPLKTSSGDVAHEPVLEVYGRILEESRVFNHSLCNQISKK